MKNPKPGRAPLFGLALAAAVATLVGAAHGGLQAIGAAHAQPAPAPAGMPPLSDPKNVYGDIGPNRLAPVTSGHLSRVYVPNLRSNDVYVIDPATLKVVDRFKVGRSPQHIVPAWDLATLWVTNNAEGRSDGSLTPIDPRTGKPGSEIPVDDPYNMYFSPDGKSAIVVAEAKKRLDFRDPRTMKLQYSIEAPECGGINHADFTPDGRHAAFTCEFSGGIVKIDLVERKVVKFLKLKVPQTRFKEVHGEAKPFPETEVCTAKKGMPQDIRMSPDGSKFYVADMAVDAVHVVDAATFTESAPIMTGVAPHGLYPSRDGKLLYVANRGSHAIHGKPGGPGSVSVIDFATDKVLKTWPIPGGGSPDMGNVSVDGRYLWLSGRFDDVIYRIDTTSGAVDKIKVGAEPHGLTVWPQPGRYSLGHTGNLR